MRRATRWLRSLEATASCLPDRRTGAGPPGPLGPRPTETLAPARADPPAHNLQQQELTTIIRRALDDLDERQRMAIVLNKFEDMNYADIADVMGLTTKAVKSLLSRARSKLREALQGYIYMDGAPPPPADEPPGGDE